MHVSLPEKITPTAFAANIALVQFNVCLLDGGLLGSGGAAVGIQRVPSCEFPLNGCRMKADFRDCLFSQPPRRIGLVRLSLMAKIGA
jgi:hypothetical protein